MEKYRILKDEELALLAQQGDDDAFSVLFLRYEPGLIGQAKKAAKRFPSFYEDEFFGYFQERFIALVQKFDVSSGVYFAKFCSFKFPKLAHDYVRGKLEQRLYGEDGKKRKSNQPSLRDKHKMLLSDPTKMVIPDSRYTTDYMQDIESTELYAHLSATSDVSAKVVTLLVQGYNYEEIAEALGRTGSAVTLRNWTKRAVRKLREEAIKFYAVSDSIDEVIVFEKAIK